MYKCNWYSRPGVNYSDKGEGGGGRGGAVETAFTSFYTGADALAVKTLRRGRGKRKRTKRFWRGHRFIKI